MRREEFDALDLGELSALRTAVEDQDRGLDHRAARAAILSGMVARGASPDEELICQAFPSLDTMPEAETELEYANQVLVAFGLPPLESPAPPKE